MADGDREGPLRGGPAAGPLRRALEGAAGAVQRERRAQGRDTALFEVREEMHSGKREREGAPAETYVIQTLV